MAPSSAVALDASACFAKGSCPTRVTEAAAGAGLCVVTPARKGRPGFTARSGRGGQKWFSLKDGHRTMKGLLKPLVVGATALSVLNLASLSPATRVHAALTLLPAADPCAAPLPASRVLPVASGIQTYTELIGGGLTFHLNQFGPHGLNAAVRRLGITLPARGAQASLRGADEEDSCT